MKKVLGSLMGILALSVVCVSAAAQGLTVDTIKFTDSTGTILTSYPGSSDAMYVKTTVDNTSEQDKYVYMLVCEYLDKGVKTYSKGVMVPAGEQDAELTVEAFVTDENNPVYASVIDRDIMFFDFINRAEFLSNSTDLDYIKVNGEFVDGYSNSVNRYSITVDTPDAEIEVKAADSSQTITITDRKLPAVIPVKVTSQMGTERIIELDIETTNPEEVQIVDENMIMWLYAGNNEGKGECNKSAPVWKDISGYETDMPVKDSWIDGALLVNAKSDAANLTALPDKVLEAINTNSFTIRFTFAPDGIEQITNTVLPIMGSDNGMMKLYAAKNDAKLNFAWGNAKFATHMPSVSVEDALSGENAIVVDGEAETVKWYINGVEKSSKALRLVNGELPQADRVTLSYIADGTGGSVGFAEIKVYDKVLTADELAGE